MLVLGLLFFLFSTGMPVAFAFMVVNIMGAVLFFGGDAGLCQYIMSLYYSVADFVFLSVFLFIFMGMVLFESGVGIDLIDTIDKLLGRTPGRLSLVSVAFGTLFGTLSGASMGAAALMCKTTLPEMEQRGYKKSMSLGPILGSAGLAIMIPPSQLIVLIGALSETSVGRLLIGGIIPGLLMAALYAGYIIIRCVLQPNLAPSYDAMHISLSEKVVSFLKHILPCGLVIFLVTGVIFLGIATPSEAAATGAVGACLLAFLHRKMSWSVMKRSILGTLRIMTMILMMVTGAVAFGQIVAFSGIGKGIVNGILSFSLPPLMIIIAIQFMYLVMGFFMSTISVMMITFPIILPVVNALGFDMVWFGILVLLNIEMGATTPPFGYTLFVMRGLVPDDTRMGDIYLAALPFLGCDLIVMVLMLIFPSIVIWLPSLMMGN